jgi:Fe-S-cluster containining protein
MLKFNCLRCGDCCRNLIVETIEGVHSGLALFPEETKHFSNEFVIPYRGRGSYPGEKDFKTVMFQLAVDVCPHLGIVDNLTICEIYDERPLSCRCFPFQPINVDRYGRITVYVGPECKAIQKTKKENPTVSNKKIGIEALAEEKSCYLLWSRISEIDRSAQGWTFDLRYQEWLPTSSRGQMSRAESRAIFRT